MEKYILKLISKYQEKQDSNKKKIDIELFEKEVINKIGSYEKYINLGGYTKFYKCIIQAETDGLFIKINNLREVNSKKPVLSRFWWLVPKYSDNRWSNETIARLSSMFDISFYIKHKRYQTKLELEKLEAIYKFMIDSRKCEIINREERSLQIFGQLHNLECGEPEKYLSSKDGTTLLRRIGLNKLDLKFIEVKEPFIYFKNRNSNYNLQEIILIVEGLSTYNTITKLLDSKINWGFQIIPNIVIWGSGRRIEGTIKYIERVVEDYKKIKIFYCGDIDLEGLDIYYNLKKNNKSLNISLAIEIYDFLIEYGINYSKPINKKQRKRNEVISEIKRELSEESKTYKAIKNLWDKNFRIAQEVISIESLRKNGYIKDE